MTRTFFAAWILLLPWLGLAPGLAQAAESYDGCSGYITSLPAVITTEGTWCMNQDLSTNITSGVAVTISTDNVAVDCNDFKLGGLAAGVGTATEGIYGGSHSSLTVRHCNIRGFQRGVNFAVTGATRNVVEDNRFDNNTLTGIWVVGSASVVRRNRVFNTGGSTVAFSPIAIDTKGSVDVIDNTVSGVTATAGQSGSAVGIYTESNATGRMIGNGVRGVLGASGGAAWGIENFSSGRVTLRDNDLQSSTTSSTGLYCSDSTGRSMDNTISGFNTASQNCGDAGGNNVLP
jgi:parallel beta-helix repeat protein